MYRKTIFSIHPNIRKQHSKHIYHLQQTTTRLSSKASVALPPTHSKNLEVPCALTQKSQGPFFHCKMISIKFWANKIFKGTPPTRDHYGYSPGWNNVTQEAADNKSSTCICDQEPELTTAKFWVTFQIFWISRYQPTVFTTFDWWHLKSSKENKT